MYSIQRIPHQRQKPEPVIKSSVWQKSHLNPGQFTIKVILVTSISFIWFTKTPKTPLHFKQNHSNLTKFLSFSIRSRQWRSIEVSKGKIDRFQSVGSLWIQIHSLRFRHGRTVFLNAFPTLRLSGAHYFNTMCLPQFDGIFGFCSFTLCLVA